MLEFYLSLALKFFKIFALLFFCCKNFLHNKKTEEKVLFFAYYEFECEQRGTKNVK